MVRRFPGTVVLALTTLTFSLRAPGQPGAAEREDPELSAGIELIRSGDMEAAVLALSKAARSLEATADRTAELTRAYVYLGVAYLELGQTQLAQAKFLDALALKPQLQLDPTEFSRKVIREFDIARSRPRVSRAPVRPSPAPNKKKGGFPVVPVVIGVAGAGAAGVALASAGSSPATTLTPSATITASYSGGAITGVTVITFSAVTTNLTSPSFVWNFGDGQTGAGASVDHRFDAEGTFSVSVTATSLEGTATATHMVVSRGLTGRWANETLPCASVDLFCWINDVVQQGPDLQGTWTIELRGVATGLLVNGRIMSPNVVTFAQDTQCRRVFSGAVTADLSAISGSSTAQNPACEVGAVPRAFRRQ